MTRQREEKHIHIDTPMNYVNKLKSQLSKVEGVEKDILLAKIEGAEAIIEIDRERNAEFRTNNADKYREYQKEYHREYREKNREKVREYQREYQRKRRLTNNK